MVLCHSVHTREIAWWHMITLVSYGDLLYNFSHISDVVLCHTVLTHSVYATTCCAHKHSLLSSYCAHNNIRIILRFLLSYLENHFEYCTQIHNTLTLDLDETLCQIWSKSQKPLTDQDTNNLWILHSSQARPLLHEDRR